MLILLLIVPFGLLALLLWRLSQSRQSPGASASGANLGGGGGGFGGAGGQAGPPGQTTTSFFGIGQGGIGGNVTSLVNALVNGVSTAIKAIFSPSGNNPSPASVNEFSTMPGAPQIGQNLPGLGIFEGSGGMSGADVMGSDLGSIGNFSGENPAVGTSTDEGIGGLPSVEMTPIEESPPPDITGEEPAPDESNFEVPPAMEEF
jgi:hypothetical protein